MILNSLYDVGDTTIKEDNIDTGNIQNAKELSKMLEHTRQVSNFCVSIPAVENDITSWNQVFQEFEKETLFRFFLNHKNVMIHGLPWWHRFLFSRSSSGKNNPPNLVRFDLNSSELQLFIEYFGSSNEMLMFGKSWMLCLYDHFMEKRECPNLIQNLIDKNPCLQKTWHEFIPQIVFNQKYIGYDFLDFRFYFIIHNEGHIKYLLSFIHKSLLEQSKSKFELVPNNALQYLHVMMTHKNTFDPQQFFNIYDVFCKTCEDIYSVTNRLNIMYMDQVFNPRAKVDNLSESEDTEYKIPQLTTSLVSCSYIQFWVISFWLNCVPKSQNRITPFMEQ